MNIRGNRFNVLFYNAAGIYFSRNQIIFNLSSSKSTLNIVKKFILCAFQNNVILCILKALGILCKALTEPYRRKTSDIENAATVGSVHRRMLRFLYSCIGNLYLLLKKKIHCFMVHYYHLLN